MYKIKTVKRYGKSGSHGTNVQRIFTFTYRPLSKHPANYLLITTKQLIMIEKFIKLIEH